MKNLKSLFAAKFLFLSCFLFVLANLKVTAQSPSFKTYMNPVIPGDHPDCTLTKVGSDFYTTGSSFNVTPVIYHSTDLVHWEAIAQPVSASWTGFGDTPGGGCWGGHVVYYNGKWWDFFSRANTMHFVKADDPKGPWSTPVKVNNPSSLPYGLGYDNSIFIDDNNKWYLVVKNGQPNGGIVELGSSGQPTGVVYDLKWLNPSPSLPYSWAEGPVMWKYDGYYYYSFARDLSGGQKVMRSKTLTADQAAWEMLGDFFNESDPQKSSSLFTSPNHASPAVMIDDSTSWVIHPIYAKNDWKGQGRQGLLNQVRYNAIGRPVADYPVNKSFTAPKLPSSGIPWMVPKSDDFSSVKLHPEWSSLGYTASGKYSLTDRPGWLRLSPKTASKGNTVIKYDGEHNYSLITRIDFNPKSKDDQAGLRLLRGDETKFVKLVSSMNNEGKKAVVFSFENTVYEVENNIGETLWLKMERINHSINGYFSSDGFNWTKVGQAFNVSVIDSYSDFSSFTGTLQGLYVQGTGIAWFDLYIYRDAYTPILAECPANQYGTTKGNTVQGIAPLVSINNNDWALYAGVEFGNDDYSVKSLTFEATASSVVNSATIEVWLDSLETGTKIADCTVSFTGGINTYKTFTAEVPEIKGNHDVYLWFKGDGSGNLMQLKSFRFTGSNLTTAIFEESLKAVKFEVFPNPATDFVTVKLYSVNSSLFIYNSIGAVVYSNPNPDPEIKIPVSLIGQPGVYFVKVNSDIRKLVVVK